MIAYFDRGVDSIERDMAELEEGLRTLQCRAEALAERADAFSHEMLPLTQAGRCRLR